MALRVDSSSSSAILSIDIGTTFLKCTLYDLNLDVISTDSSRLNILHPKDGYSELEPNELLNQIKECIKNCLKNNTKKSITSSSIRCAGISTQRNSVLLWNKETGVPSTNFVLWNDKRDTEISDSLNYAVSVRGLKAGSKLLSTFVSSHRFIAFSKYRYSPIHVPPKLLWIFKHLPKNTDMSKMIFGCIETWIMWKLTKENVHATDWSCASCTGLFDFFLGSWSSIMCPVSGIPRNILPNVNDTCHRYGTIDKTYLDSDVDIPITAIIGDAQSSIIAECAFNIGDIVITIGTGAFISVNCGDKPVSSQYGSYPMVGFKYQDESIFIIHHGISAAGVAIEWAKSLGLFESYSDIDDLLKSVEDSNGVYFVPGFGPIEIDSKDMKAAAGFIGIKPNTTKAHLLRAVFDSIVFGIKEKFDAMIKDLELLKIKVNSIRLCGGVSQSRFLCQYLTELLEHTTERTPTGRASSSLGAALCAGLGAGIWVKKEELNDYRKNVEYFEPSSSSSSSSSATTTTTQGEQQTGNFKQIHLKNTERDIIKWNKAVERCMNWYD